MHFRHTHKQTHMLTDTHMHKYKSRYTDVYSYSYGHKQTDTHTDIHTHTHANTGEKTRRSLLCLMGNWFWKKKNRKSCYNTKTHTHTDTVYAHAHTHTGRQTHTNTGGGTRRKGGKRSPKTQSSSHNTETEWHQPLLSSPYAANTKGSLEQKSNQSSLGGFAPQQCSATLVTLLVTKK